MLPLVNGPILAILQTTIEPHMQGRFFSTMTSVAGLAAPIGLMLAGPVAERLGGSLLVHRRRNRVHHHGGRHDTDRSILSMEDSPVMVVDQTTAP